MQLFKKFASIPKTNDKAKINFFRELGYMLTSIIWWISEKYHGCNFSFIAEKDETSPVRHASRDAMLEDDKGNIIDNLHDFSNLPATAKFDKAVKAMARYLGKPIQVYTELYGYGITGPGKIQTKEERALEQKDPYIVYKPIVSEEQAKLDRDYVVLRIRICNELGYEAKTIDERDCDKFLSKAETAELCAMFGLPMAEVLMEGTFDECLAFNNDYLSVAASKYGLEEKAEGYVMAPVEPLYDPYTDGSCVMFKSVASAFSDVKTSMQLSGGNKQAKKEVKVDTINSEHLALITARANSVRVTNRAAAKGIARVEKNKFSELINAVVTDIIDEVKREENTDVDKAHVTKLVVPFVKQFFE